MFKLIFLVIFGGIVLLISSFASNSFQRFPNFTPLPSPSVSSSASPSASAKTEKTSSSAPLNAPTYTTNPQPQDIIYSETINYYHIEGIRPEDLRSQMDQQGPIDDTNNRRDANTKWDIYWSYPFSNTAGGCGTGPVKVETKIVYTFPKWNNGQTAAEDQKAKWDRYMEALKVHEMKHKDIALQGAREILQILKNFPSYPTCEILDEEANKASQNQIQKIQNQQHQYDQDTDHGASQGARFP